MRRLSVILALVSAIAVAIVPAVAAGGTGNAGDGSLVVRKGSAPYVPGVSGTPVVQLTITGSVIGQVNGTGKLVIDAGPNADSNAEPIVTGAGLPSDSPRSDTAQVWHGTGFKFRAVGGTYTVLVYGTQVNLVAVGTGTVRLAGMPDTPNGDGQYSLNGNPFVSLPGAQTDKRSIAATTG